MAPEDPFCSICIFSLKGGIGDPGSPSCRKCLKKARRPNFYSIYRDESKPGIPSLREEIKPQAPLKSGNDRISSLIKEASGKTKRRSRSLDRKMIETWDRLTVGAKA